MRTCCVFDSPRLSLPLLAAHFRSYRLFHPPSLQLLLPRCGGQIPCTPANEDPCRVRPSHTSCGTDVSNFPLRWTAITDWNTSKDDKAEQPKHTSHSLRVRWESANESSSKLAKMIRCLTWRPTYWSGHYWLMSTTMKSSNHSGLENDEHLIAYQNANFEGIKTLFEIWLLRNHWFLLPMVCGFSP